MLKVVPLVYTSVAKKWCMYPSASGTSRDIYTTYLWKRVRTYAESCFESLHSSHSQYQATWLGAGLCSRLIMSTWLKTPRKGLAYPTKKGGWVIGAPRAIRDLSLVGEDLVWHTNLLSWQHTYEILHTKNPVLKLKTA